MTDFSVEVKRITCSDDLTDLTKRLNAAAWDKANDIKGYDERYVKEFVEKSDNVLLVAYFGDKVAGVSLASKNYAPYKDNESWLYIDEVDVSPEFRRQGIGKMMMEKLFEIGQKMGLDEAWVGTEPDNDPANHLYKSLSPSEMENFIGYTYKLKNKKV
jgi:ribosomal protein S18 acetylase RimI-like enzyme